MKLALALQETLVAHLRADPALAAALGGPHVYDAPPHASADEANLPNIVLGDESIDAWSSEDMGGAEHLLSFSIWSRQRGYSEVKAIMAALHDALDGATLSLPGGTLILLRFVSANTGRAAKGRLRTASCRFRALVEHAQAA